MQHTAMASTLGLYIASIERLEPLLRIVALLLPIVVAIVQVCRRPPRRENRKVKRSLSVLPLSLVGVWLALFCCGCVNTAAVVKALGADTNSVAVQVTTPWGTVAVKRN